MQTGTADGAHVTPALYWGLVLEIGHINLFGTEITARLLIYKSMVVCFIIFSFRKQFASTQNYKPVDFIVEQFI